MLFSILFEYVEGGTDYVRIEADDVHQAAQKFHDRYTRETREILSVEPAETY